MKKTIWYKNTPISYTVKGTGSALVLLHGFLEDKTMWSLIEKELLTKNKVICIDLLGHGESGCLGYVHTMETMAEAVKVVLNNEKLRRVKLIGHSMGGYVALAFAEKHSKNVKGLCLLNATAYEDSEERNEMRLRAITMARHNYEGLVSMSITNLFLKETKEQFSSEINECKKIGLKTSVQGYIACAEGMRIRKNRLAVLEGATFKKLFVIGENDTVLDCNVCVNEAVQTNSLYIILSGGHMSHIENKKELIPVLVNF